MTYRTDQTQLRRAQQGDMEAFADMFEPLRSTAVAVATRYVGATDAEDVAMDAYLKAWQGLPQFRGKNLKSWLLQIVRHAALDRIRYRERHPHLSIDATQANGDQPRTSAPSRELADPTTDSPSETAIRDETVETVQLALQQLPDLYRISLQLRYADGLSYSEIAGATGVSIGTVMSRLHNGKQRLRKLLRSTEEDRP